MIKASGAIGGKPLLILGLSRENLDRLPRDQPIHVGFDELVMMGLPGMEIVIVGGETEESIAAMLKSHWPGMDDRSDLT